MTAIPFDTHFFDTHFFIKKLTAEGMPEKQAESVVAIIRETKEFDFNTMATKGDLNDIKGDLKVLKGDLKIMEAAMDAKLRELELRLEANMIKWMVGLLFLQAGFIVTIIKLL